MSSANFIDAVKNSTTTLQPGQTFWLSLVSLHYLKLCYGMGQNEDVFLHFILNYIYNL